MKRIKKFNKLFEDDFDVEELQGDNTQYLKTKYAHAMYNLEKIIDRCLHDIEKERLISYITEYINNSTIVKKEGGYGFYGADTDDDN